LDVDVDVGNDCRSLHEEDFRCLCLCLVSVSGVDVGNDCRSSCEHFRCPCVYTVSVTIVINYMRNILEALLLLTIKIRMFPMRGTDGFRDTG